MADEWTIGRLLTWTAEHLKKSGSESPRLEAEVLLAHAKGCKRIELYTSFEDVAGDDLRTRFRELIRRRAEGTPVAYLVGHREFYSLDFRVTPDVLIPRPETELLVVKLLDLVKSRGKTEHLQIADVGTGSGIIAVAVARHAPAAHVTALDISSAALAVARENAERLGVADRVAFVESDLLSVTSNEPAYDFIASNPPYVTTSELDSLPRDVREHEPRLALDGGQSGTVVIERLISQASQRLRPGGSLLLEISPMLQQRVESLLSADSRLEAVSTAKDLSGRARVAQARRRSEPGDA